MEWKNKFVIYFVIVLVVVFGVFTFKAMDKGKTTVTDVLEKSTEGNAIDDFFSK